MEPAKVSSFKMPRREDVEVHLVKLDDGRIVARTADELHNITQTAAPQPPAATLTPPAKK